MLKEIEIPLRDWKKQLESIYEYVEEKSEIPEIVNEKFIENGQNFLSELTDDEKEKFYDIEERFKDKLKKPKSSLRAKSISHRTDQYLRKK